MKKQTLKTLKTLKSPKGIKLGQFYKALSADGYYYVGVKYGKGNRVSCINIDYDEADIDGNNFLDDDNIPEWRLVECSQEEAMGAQ